MKSKAILTTALLSSVMCVSTLAADVKVIVNNEQVVFPDAQPKIINNSTMVPVRGIFEKLGFEVEWDNLAKIATLRGKYITISANETVLYANSSTGQVVNLDQTVMPVLSEGRLYLPLRVIAQSTGYVVDWDGDTKTVNIAKPDVPADGEVDDTPISEEGSMLPDEQQYLEAAFGYLEDIKSEMIAAKDPSLMKFYNVGRNPIAAKSDLDYSKILADIEGINSLTIPKNLEDVGANISRFAELVSQVCSLAKDNSIDDAALNAQVGALEQDREAVSENYSVNLVKFFNEKKVSFESIFTEYCLDYMNY